MNENCPFCGESENLSIEFMNLRTPDTSEYPAWVACRNCGCNGKVVWINDENYEMDVKLREKLAFEAWNNRCEFPNWLKKQVEYSIHTYENVTRDKYMEIVLHTLKDILTYRKNK